MVKLYLIIFLNLFIGNSFSQNIGGIDQRIIINEKFLTLKSSLILNHKNISIKQPLFHYMELFEMETIILMLC